MKKMNGKRVGLNRREFLGASLTVAGVAAFPYVVPGSVIGAAGTVPPSERIVMGGIGLGGMGQGDLRGFLSKKEVQVVIVCDVDDQHAAQAKGRVDKAYGNSDCRTTRDYREVVGRADVDAVFIATPDHWHAIPAIAAAKARKDIHAQKPLAYNVAEGRAIVRAVQKYGVVWQTGSQQRSGRNFRHACEIVRNGLFGKVHTVKVGLPPRNSIRKGDRTFKAPPPHLDYDRWLGPAPYAPYCDVRCHWNFRWISDYAGGQITDWAGHHCDIAQWGMNTEHTGPVEIEGTGVWPTDPLFNTVENYTFTCKYKEGFTMIVSGSFERGVRFEGEDGWVFVSRRRIDASNKALLSHTFGPSAIRLYRSDDHKQNFLDCVKTRKECVAPAEVAQRSISVGHLGLIAIKLKRKVHWDPVRERFVNDPEADRLLSRPMRSPWRLPV